MWKIIAKIGCPSTFVNMFKELHRNVKADVTFNSHLSGILTRAFKNCYQDFPLRFRISGKVLNIRRLNTKSEKFVELIRELLYADDALFFAHRQTDMQHIIDQFSPAYDAFRLTISLKKTKVMFTIALCKPYIEPNITVNGTRLVVVNTFVYLGSTVFEQMLKSTRALARHP